MIFNNSIKYAIAFCFIALMSSNTSAQSTAAGELIFNGDFNRMNTGVPFTAARADISSYAPLPWNVITGSIGDTKVATDIEITMPIWLDPRIVNRADLPGFDSSPVGGSFMGFNATDGLFQNVRFFDTSTDDTSLPDSITIEFYYTEYNRNTDTTDLTPGFPSPTVDLEITLNEFNFSYILLAEIPNLFATGGTPGTWEKRSVTFSTANAGITDSRTTYKLSIVYRGTNVNDYVFIDGVSARASGLVDTDGDGITDVNEPGTQNDPCLPAQAAGYTGFHAANPLWQAADCDGDGVNNGQEVIDGTDPYAPPTCGGDGPILIQN